MLATITVLWLLGIVPAFIALREEARANKDLWWVIPCAVFWPLVFYVAMFVMAGERAWKYMRGARKALR